MKENNIHYMITRPVSVGLPIKTIFPDGAIQKEERRIGIGLYDMPASQAEYDETFAKHGIPDSWCVLAISDAMLNAYLDGKHVPPYVYDILVGHDLCGENLEASDWQADYAQWLESNNQ